MNRKVLFIFQLEWNWSKVFLILKSCTEYKYLGVIFNNKGKLNNSAENLSEKARNAYFYLRSKIPYSNFISGKVGCLTVNTQNIVKDHIFNFFK
jgi:hypothetical protein